MKNGSAGRGAKHSDYIGGAGQYAERPDLVHGVDKNLPEWAKDATEFFRAADQLERATGKPYMRGNRQVTPKGRAYREIEAAIPRDVKDPVAYATKYAEQLLGDRHTYRLAVHDKMAADGGRNIHMHLMFTERINDGVPRSQEQYFKRASAPYRHRVTKEMMPADPAKGGAVKDRKWNDKSTTDKLRRDYEAHAKAQGVTLDLRSNLAQGLTRPEPKIGPQRKRTTPDLYQVERKTEVKQIRTNRNTIDQVKTELTTIEKEQRNARIKERRNAHRANNRSAGRTVVQDLRRIDDLQAGAGQDVLLQRHERHNLAEHQAEQIARRVHELDADRTSRPAVDVQAQALAALRRLSEIYAPAPTQAPAPAQVKTPTLPPDWREQLARTQAANAARIAAQDAEKQARQARRQAWQAKHVNRHAIALAAGTPPQPGKPKYWEYTDGPAKGKPAVIDYGDRLKPAGKTVSDTKIAAMLEVAKAKGWTSISVSGPADFRQRVADAARARGIGLSDRDLVKAPTPAPTAAPLSKVEQYAKDLTARVRADQAAADMEEQKRFNAETLAKFNAAPQAPTPTAAPRLTPAPTPAPTHAPTPATAQPTTPAPPQKPISELQKEAGKLKSQIYQLDNNLFQYNERVFDSAKAKAEASQIAEQSYERKYLIDNPRCSTDEQPRRWPQKRDLYKMHLELHLEEKRPTFRNAEYDDKTIRLRDGVEHYRKLSDEKLKAENELARPIYIAAQQEHNNKEMQKKAQLDNDKRLIEELKNRLSIIEREIESRPADVAAEQAASQALARSRQGTYRDNGQGLGNGKGGR